MFQESLMRNALFYVMLNEQITLRKRDASRRYLIINLDVTLILRRSRKRKKKIMSNWTFVIQYLVLLYVEGRKQISGHQSFNFEIKENKKIFRI